MDLSFVTIFVLFYLFVFFFCFVFLFLFVLRTIQTEVITLTIRSIGVFLDTFPEFFFLLCTIENSRLIFEISTTSSFFLAPVSVKSTINNQHLRLLIAEENLRTFDSFFLHSYICNISFSVAALRISSEHAIDYSS